MVVVKHVVFFVLLVAVTIAKPPDKPKESEKSLQYEALKGDKRTSLSESIFTKRRPLIIKSKIMKPRNKKRFIGRSSRPKKLHEPDDSKKSALTFALDSDDNSLSSIISMIVKLLEQEEQAEMNSKGTDVKVASNPNTKSQEISEHSDPTSENPAKLIVSERNIILPQSSVSNQNEVLTSNKKETAINLSLQTSPEPTLALKSDLTTTLPSNFILETSVSFEPPLDNISLSTKETKRNKEISSTNKDNLKTDALNNLEESSGDIIDETDDDSKHYCPEGFKDEDKIDMEDSIGDLDKLILSSESSPKTPVEVSEDKTTPILIFEMKPNSEIETETTIFPTTSNSLFEFETKTESTTLESLYIEERLSETTTISPSILTDSQESLIPQGPFDLYKQEFSTTEKQNEDTTVSISHNTEYFNYVTTEQGTSVLLTTSDLQNGKPVEATVVNNEIINQDVTTTPSVINIEKLDFNTAMEAATVTTLKPLNEVSYEFTTVTEKPIPTSTISQASSLASTILPHEELLDKIDSQLKPLPETFVEPSSYPTTPITELRFLENQTYISDENNEKLGGVLKPSTESATSEATAVSTEATITTQLTNIISPSSSISSLYINKSSQEKEAKQENPVRAQISTAKPASPHSRLITFTLYDRKEKYTSLKHFIDYLRSLKK